MAYINSQGMQDEDEQVGLVGTNIFQNTMAGGQPSPSQNALTAPDQSQPITPQAPGSASAGAGQPRQVQGGTAGQAFKRNVGKNQSTLDADGIAGRIGQSRTDYGNAADDYMAKIGNAANYTVGGDDVTGALDGDVEKSEKVKKRLNQAPDALEEFKPEINTDYGADENKFTFGGLKQNYREQGGPMGTRGEAGFDASLLQQDVGFQQDRAQVRQANQDLRNVVKEKDDFRGLNAQKNYQAAWDQGSKDSRSLVQKAIDDIVGKAEGQRLAEQQKRDAYMSQYVDSTGNTYGLPPEVRAQVEAELRALADSEFKKEASFAGGQQRLDGALANLSNQDMIDYDQFVRFNGPVSMENFLSQQDADKANRGAGLLGQGGGYVSSFGQQAPQYQVNSSAMRAALRQLLARQQVFEPAGRDIEVEPMGAGPGAAPDRNALGQAVEDVGAEIGRGSEKVKDKVLKPATKVVAKAVPNLGPIKSRKVF